MSKLSQQHSERTKNELLKAAARLFTEKGYNAVTIREIARNAGCSHTTLYIYFKDKEALLYALSEPSLTHLKAQLEHVLSQKNNQSEQKLISFCLLFIHFCLRHRNMYRIFFETKPSRVDEAHPEIEINKIRIEIFQLLKQALCECLPNNVSDSAQLSYSRILFYLIRGIIGTYMESEETVEALSQRLTPTFIEAFDVLLTGFTRRVEKE
ncbi:TetR/AcrR family transcriptional regulator [Sporolactobacillus kofuensis]|uniref:TetR/AcrR family transcriptional regulator n=1 Tax=Sporolactobacillus kofuensis TaxID=269672 RepID=A0ABW1WHL0_9BACL|nr:TetR/AcrR family transcriptional regulator [Sporolactobacillus kofuensis]MCO7176680.1 TetR/AcrR family transcriptional regulator [Sporolactobacillus kofuensis]